MNPIRRALRIDPDTVRTVVDHLDRHVAPHLTPDVSNYARGRQRAWLQIEAPLGPTQPWHPGLASHRLWPWLVAVWRRIDPDTVPQVGLAVHGNRGIAWHRDASYAHARAALVNLGPCTFELDRARDSANGRPVDPVSLRLSGGEVLDFDCTPSRALVRGALAPAPGARRRSRALVRRALAPQAASPAPRGPDPDPLSAADELEGTPRRVVREHLRKAGRSGNAARGVDSFEPGPRPRAVKATLRAPPAPFSKPNPTATPAAALTGRSPARPGSRKSTAGDRSCPEPPAASRKAFPPATPTPCSTSMPAARRSSTCATSPGDHQPGGFAGPGHRPGGPRHEVRQSVRHREKVRRPRAGRRTLPPRPLAAHPVRRHAAGGSRRARAQASGLLVLAEAALPCGGARARRAVGRRTARKKLQDPLKPRAAARAFVALSA